MTGPITFDPILSPLLPETCDGVDAFTDVSTGAAADFAKVNARFANRTVRLTRFGGNQVANGSYVGFSNWVPINPSLWPAATITLPPTVVAALFTVRGYVNSAVSGTYPQINLACDVTGPGVAHAIPTKDLTSVASLWGVVEGVRAYLFKPGDLIGGQPVTVTPYVAHNDVNGATISGGGWNLLVFHGGPA